MGAVRASGASQVAYRFHYHRSQFVIFHLCYNSEPFIPPQKMWSWQTFIHNVAYDHFFIIGIVSVLFVYSVLSLCEPRQKNDIRMKVLMIYPWEGSRL